MGYTDMLLFTREVTSKRTIKNVHRLTCKAPNTDVSNVILAASHAISQQIYHEA